MPGTIVLYETGTRAVHSTFECPRVFHLTPSPDGQVLALYDGDREDEVQLWDISNVQLKPSLDDRMQRSTTTQHSVNEHAETQGLAWDIVTIRISPGVANPQSGSPP
jgi:hypothetical protein